MSRDRPAPNSGRGRYPRPRMSLQELIGLVVAFAVSNAFLSWMNPQAASDAFLFLIWNLALGFYLGFAFLQAWIRSVVRSIRAGDRSPPARIRTRWTALGVAETTVIGGTLLACLWLMLEKWRNQGLDGDDLAVLTAITLIGAASAIVVRTLWRRGQQRVTPLADVGRHPLK